MRKFFRAIALVRSFSVIGVLMVVASGCAHSENKPEPAQVTGQSGTTGASGFSPTLQVDFPYGFTRRGVEIRAYSVEISSGQFLVTLSLHESRGEEADIEASTLMEARTGSNQILPYVGYQRSGQKQTGSGIHLAANERVPVDLIFQLPPDATPETSVMIQFRTGKWWRS